MKMILVNNVQTNDDNDSFTVNFAPVPSHADITAMLIDLQYMPFNCNLSEVAVLLWEVKRGS